MAAKYRAAGTALGASTGSIDAREIHGDSWAPIARVGAFFVGRGWPDGFSPRNAAVEGLRPEKCNQRPTASKLMQ